MNQKIKDGIVIDSTVYINDEKKSGFPIYMKLLQLLAVNAGSASVISILIKCFALEVTMSQILTVIFLSSLVMFLLFQIPSYDTIKLVSIATVYLIFLRYNFKHLRNAFYLLENAVIERASSYYGFGAFRYQADYIMGVRDMTLFITAVLLPIVVLLSVAVLKNRLIAICDIVLLLPVAASFAVGVTPQETYLIAYILVMLFMTRSYETGLRTGFKGHNTILGRVNIRAAIILCLTALVLFSGMKLIMPSKKYEKFYKIDQTKADIQNFLFNFNAEDYTKIFNNMNIKILPDRSSASGGLNGGKLGDVDQVKYNDTEHLRLTAPLNSLANGLYLKGYVGSVYTGHSWVGPTKEMNESYDSLLKDLPKESFQPVNQGVDLLKKLENVSSAGGGFFLRYLGVQNFNYYKGSISVDYKAANKKYIYAPYFTDFSSSGAAKYLSDQYAAPLSKKGSYKFDYYYNFNVDFSTNKLDTILSRPAEKPDFGDYSEYEKLYRDYVYKYYTQLPDTGLDRLRKDFSRENVGTAADSLQSAIAYIKQYLDMNTHYTLSPGRLPDGKDFVEYFLYDNKAGYCTHYASAAVLMLRAMGYPARYAEGYAVGGSEIVTDAEINNQDVTYYSDNNGQQESTPEVQLSVKDYDAHAWAEVYIDGIGWYPVEFTPGSSVETSDKAVDNMENFGSKIKAENQPSETPAPTEAPTPSVKPAEPTLAPGTTATPTPAVPVNKNRNNGSSGTTESKGKAAGVFAWLLIAIAAAILVTLSGFYLNSVRRKRSTNIDNNRRALRLYRQIEKLFAVCRALPKKDKSLEDNIDYVKEHYSRLKEEDFTSCMDTVRKARFGRSLITPSELSEVESFYNSLNSEVYQNSSILKKAYLRLIML